MLLLLLAVASAASPAVASAASPAVASAASSPANDAMMLLPVATTSVC
jgi:hypothetical protein